MKKISKKRKVSRLIALWVVFAMLITPFVDKADMEKGVKAEEGIPFPETCKINSTISGVETKTESEGTEGYVVPKSDASVSLTSITMHLAKGYQQANIIITKDSDTIIGYDDKYKEIKAKYEIKYLEYSTDPTEVDTNLPVDTTKSLVNYDTSNGIKISETKKIAVYAKVSNIKDVKYNKNKDGTYSYYEPYEPKTRYELIGLYDIQFDVLNFTLGTDGIHLENGENKWSGENEQLIEDTNKKVTIKTVTIVEAPKNPEISSAQYKIQYAFIEKGNYPTSDNYADQNKMSGVCDKAYDVYVALIDICNGKSKSILKSVKVGTYRIVDSGKEEIKYSWNTDKNAPTEFLNNAPTEFLNQAQTVTVKATTYKKITNAKITCKINNASDETVLSDNLTCATDITNGYYENIFAATIPSDETNNTKYTDIKLKITYYGGKQIEQSLGSFMYDKTSQKVSWRGQYEPSTWYKADSDSSQVTLTVENNSENDSENVPESEISEKKYSINGGVEKPITVDNINVPKATNSTGTKVTINTKDAAGNSYRGDFYFKFDGTSPKIESVLINDKKPDSVIANKDATIKVKATDAESGLSKIEYCVDGQSVLTKNYDEQGTVKLQDILKDTQGNAKSDGNHKIEIKVYDKVENFATKTINLTYDNKEPTYTATLVVSSDNGSSWTSVTDLADGVCNVDTKDNKIYGYKLEIEEDNLEDKVSEAVSLPNNESTLLVELLSTESFLYNNGKKECILKLDNNKIPSTATAPTIKIKDKAGNECEVEGITKVQSINQNIVAKVEVYLNDKKIDDTTKLKFGTNAKYRARVTLECPKNYKDITAKVAEEALPLYNSDGTETFTAEGRFDEAKKVYVKNFDIKLLADDKEDITKLFKNINVSIKTTAWEGEALPSEPNNKYWSFSLNNVLFDRSKPVVVLTATTDENKWVKDASFEATAKSGKMDNESALSSANYNIDNEPGSFTISQSDPKITEKLNKDIPESKSTAGTKVTFNLSDVAGNELIETHTYFVDKHEPSIENISIRKNQRFDLLSGDPVITADLKDNLTLNKVEVKVTGSASKTTYVTYDKNIDGKTEEFEQKLVNFVADADKNGTVVKDGEYTVELKLYDMAGNVSRNAVVSFVVDNTKPVVNAEISAATIKNYRSPVDVNYYNGAVTVDFDYIEKNLDSVIVKDNGKVVDPVWNGANAVYTTSTEGKHTVTINMIDKAGHAAEEKTVSFIIDKTQPVVSASVNNTNNPDNLIEMMVNANVKAAVMDASNATIYYQTIYSKPYEKPTSSEYKAMSEGGISFADEGEYTVNFYAIDAANNKSATRTVDFRIDKTAPVVKIGNLTSAVSAEAKTLTFSVDEAFWKEAKCTVNLYKKAGDGKPESLVKTIDIKPTEKLTTVTERLSESGEYRFEIEASDSIGHTVKESANLKIDIDKPTISVSGVERYDVTDKPVSFKAEMNDNFYASKTIRFEGTRKDIDGKSNKVEAKIVGEKGSPALIDEIFEEDGIYDITLTVSDEAGNSVKRELHFTIDKTAPVIKDLSSLNGRVMKSFDWDEDVEDIVNDLTVCDTHMYLNGSEYDGSTKLEDGVYTLLITAVDEVGHESKLENVSFTIDSKAPTFIVTGVEDGDEKEETYDISVSLQLEEDTLQEVKLNGETIEIKDNQATLSVSDKGDYKLYMRAVDEAGNEAEQTIEFSYGKKKSGALILILAVSGGVLAAGGAIFAFLKFKK